MIACRRISRFLVLLHYFALIFGNIAGTANARTWDIAVTVGQEIDFFMSDSRLIGRTLIAEASDLVGIAYDDSSHTMYFSDKYNKSFSIFSVDLSQKNVTSKPLVKRKIGTQVLGIVYDKSTRTLFWTENNALMKMQMSRTGLPSEPVILHDLRYKSPRGIALDICNKQIYWINGNRTNPSLERSNFDGSDRTVIISRNLYEPSCIAIDNVNKKLYWIDDEEGIHYKLERSNLDSTNREMLVHGTHQQPVSLSVDNNYIYWTDFVYRSVWFLKKDVQATDQPKEFNSYYKSNRESDPTYVITRDSVDDEADCNMVSDDHRTKINLPPPAPTIESFNNLTTSTEVVDPKEEFLISCSKNGVYNKLNGTCACKPGFSGHRCEISPCHNYCLRGECFVNSFGTPKCKCPGSFNGARCENDTCNGFCLNEGRCYLDDNGKAACECKYSSGSRCENTLDMVEICTIYCINRQLRLNSIDTSSCRCSELNKTIEEVITYDSFNCTILVPILSGFIGMLTIVIIILGAYIKKLRRRPRIKKRFVVNKSGITPLTSRPQMNADQCEITIENCCNMNICETPCFEPALRSTSTKNKKKEEKSNLLDNMEGNSC